jgi:hypothetical protein
MHLLAGMSAELKYSTSPFSTCTRCMSEIFAKRLLLYNLKRPHES